MNLKRSVCKHSKVNNEDNALMELHLIVFTFWREQRMMEIFLKGVFEQVSFSTGAMQTGKDWNKVKKIELNWNVWRLHCCKAANSLFCGQWVIWLFHLKSFLPLILIKKTHYIFFINFTNKVSFKLGACYLMSVNRCLKLFVRIFLIFQGWKVSFATISCLKTCCCSSSASPSLEHTHSM